MSVFFRPVGELLKLKEEKRQALKRLGIENVRDLLFYSPISYKVKKNNPNLSQLRDGEFIQTEITIKEISFPQRRGHPVKILASNETGTILLVFFNKISKFILPRLRVGSRHRISGKIQFFDYYFQIAHPEFLFGGVPDSSIEPLYGLTYGLLNKQLHFYILKVLDIVEKELADDPIIINSLKILHLKDSENVNPSFIEKVWEETREKLAWEELKAGQASLNLIRKSKSLKYGRSFAKNGSAQSRIMDNLGFELTNSQKKVLEEIEKDQASPVQMNRMLQGDVGSGKTLVALLSAANVAGPGLGSILMVPTDLLARQHYEFALRWRAWTHRRSHRWVSGSW